MRIYTKAGDLAFKTFTFSDGQPHFKLETYEREFDRVVIEVALRSTSDLFTTALAIQVLRAHGYSQVDLDIRYLLGARMDRAISVGEPFTLQTVAAFINSWGCSRVRILDAHSEVATRLIRNSENILPMNAVLQSINALSGAQVVIPDKGAIPRIMTMLPSAGTILCSKVRDITTGHLSGFKVEHYYSPLNKTALIVDDICDGGRTFSEIAKVVKELGVKSVNLFVTHGIFSKGLPLEGIDKVFTTDSYFGVREAEAMNGNQAISSLVVIPISMEKL